ncbi:MAG: hypothetical protein IJU76_02475 [Desulfovibrionaceae bacterium]|nr:hypothetical protein [Desulfovibrionaceae bacterium]
MEYAYIRMFPDEDSQQLANLPVPEKNRFVDLCPSEKCSRPQLQCLINTVQHGDIVHIQSVEHLATSSQSLQSIAREFFIRGAVLHFHAAGVLLFSENALTLLYHQHCYQESRVSTYAEAQKEKVKELFRQDMTRKVSDVSKETGVSRAMCYHLRKKVQAEVTL